MKKLKEGDYYINIANSSLRSVNNNEDFTDMIGDFSKFSYLGIGINGDTIRLINSPIRGFIFVSCPSVDGKYIRLNEILKIKEGEKNKVTSAESGKRYEVYDESIKLASDMDLDTVFCLIKGYVDTYFNQPLKITIKENEVPEQ